MSQTIAAQTATYLQRMLDVYYKQFGCSGSTTTFDLYRRVNTGPPDDLGVPTNAIQKIYSSINCALIGLQEIREGAFDVIPEGQIQYPMIEAITSLLDVQAGDNLILALDGRGWGVERAERFGSLMVMVLDRASSQV